jgi:hypothetical protein
MRIKVHWSEFDPMWSEATVQLRVKHLLGDHYEIWKGGPGFWSNDQDMPLTRKRNRKLNAEHRRRKAQWRAFHRAKAEYDEWCGGDG